jgi:hypothetical protein
MLTRALFALVLVGLTVSAWAEDAQVLALGITDHQVTQEELDKGAALPAPHFNTPAIAYASVANLKKGDTVEIALVNGETPLLHNTETLAEDSPGFLLQAGKRGVPAGGWPEGSYHATLKVTRDGKTLVEQSSAPIRFD